MFTPTAAEPTRVANYWEDDTTANPKIVRIIDQDNEFFNVELPNHEGTRQVHMHTLGKPHYVY